MKIPSLPQELGSTGTVYSLHRTSSACDLKEAEKRHPLFEIGIKYQRNGSSLTVGGGVLNGSVDSSGTSIRDANWCTNDADVDTMRRARAASFVFDRRPSMQVIKE